MDDWAGVAAKAEKFIREQVVSAEAGGVIFGLSGGIDSTVVAYLCCRALGRGRCMALLMPNSAFTPPSETVDGMLVAESLAIPHRTIQIGKISKAATEHEHEAKTDPTNNRVNVGNLNARLRAALLYYEAHKRNYLVVGTDDRSEHLIGYFTKYGDGACDLLPIAELYKSQVWELARHLGVPRHIIDKEPSPHLWENHSISNEIGIGYETIDAILECMPDGTGVEDAAAISERRGVPIDDVRRVISLHRSSEHKRHMPPVANLMELRTAPAAPVICKRPWGSFERLTLNSASTVKMLEIDPDASISLQRHSHRSEFWRVVSGEAVAVLDGETISLAEGDNLLIPVGAVHRLTGGSRGARILEIATGDFSENDIVRLEDGWGRT
ncbi:MAG: NAD+ synthase [Candidatus Poribacteria bacterium]|nr:NAD+ synthase [Candidatus Poribacteria bacterium]